MPDAAELSKSLALAIGYAPESVLIDGTICYVYRTHRPDIPQMLNWAEERWYSFDYTDPTVCLPLIEWLGSEYRKFFWYCSPTSLAGPRWSCSGGGIIAPTLAEAVARAAIAVKGGG